MRKWLVKPQERSLFLLLACLLLLFVFIHAVLHDIKDTVTVGYIGAEFLAFMKFWITLPGAILFFLVYSKLSHHFSQETIATGILLVFGAFFLLFSFVFFPILHFQNNPIPLRETTFTASSLLQYWDIALFYLMSELWGNITIGVLFWGFANRTLRLSVAKRLYTPLNMAAALGSIFGGMTGSVLASLVHRSAFGYDLTLKFLSIIVTISIILGITLYQKVRRALAMHPHLLQKAAPRVLLSESHFIDSVRSVFASKTLLLTATLVICFGLTYNLVEIIWKYQVRGVYPNLNLYAQFMARVTATQGLVSGIAIVVGANIILKLGWFRTALLTPFTLLLVSTLFFGSLLVNNALVARDLPLGWLALLPLYLGALDFICVRTCRLAFFEPTKEMIFIPLNQNLKTTGKAAVDVMSDRFGKGAGSLGQYLAIAWLGSVASFVPYAFISILLLIGIWIYAIARLRSFIKRFREPNRQILNK